MFAPKKGASPTAAEDDGYLLSFLSNWQAGISEFVVFDASDVSKGPIYRAPLSVALPAGLHGSFANGLTFEQEDIISRWKGDTLGRGYSRPYALPTLCILSYIIIANTIRPLYHTHPFLYTSPIKCTPLSPAPPACNSLDRQSGWNEVKSGFSGLGITIE